jgi:hypothetical protein
VHEIILPFSVAGEVWKDGGNSGIQVKREIHNWLRESNLHWTRAFKSNTEYGFPHSVIFRFPEKSHAALFKLTWGGR